MNRENLVVKEIFNSAIQNHKKNDIKSAEQLYNQVLIKDPNHFGSIFYLGSIYLQNRNFIEAKKLFEKAVKIKPSHAEVHHNLGQSYKELGDVDKAIKCFQKAIKIQPKILASHNNLGVMQKELGNNEEAIKCFQNAIKIQPNFAASHNNLGIVYVAIKQFENAIKCFENAIKNNSRFTMAHYNLGKVYKELKNYTKAVQYFENANTTRSRAEILESLYFSKDFETYSTTLNKFTESDPLNLRIATMAEYVSKKENVTNDYPFCRDPLKYVYTNNLKGAISDPDKFCKNLSSILNNVDFIWEPATKSTTRGYHTSGNLFNRNDHEIIQLQNLIKNEINIYLNQYKSSKDYFIKKWPQKNKLESWHVKLLKNGYQKPHIHPAGWLSGCFYLKIPKMLKDHQGAIKFTLSGYDYPFDKKLPDLVHVPKIFDIALFPSSLFHETVPFDSSEERHVIAFDLMPV